MKIVLVSVHDAQSGRKTGFHFWMDILAERGMDVRFITAGSSRLSLLKKEGKPLIAPFNEWVSLSYQIRKFTWLPLFHPLYLGNGILSKLTAPVFKFYPRLMPQKLIDEVRDAELFIVESGAGPLLVPTFAKHCPNARFIYNFSDRKNVVKFHPSVVEGSAAALPYFSLIRLNAASVAQDFPPDSPTIYIPQAIDKSTFDESHPNPYATPRNAISIGDMLFDAPVIERLATEFPDWTFHLFGRKSKLSRPFDNVKEYGEYPFDDIIPYIKHADIGLAPYNDHSDAAYLSQSSLKLVQYTYCRLPIVTPDFAATGRDHAIGYNARQPQTAVNSFAQAMLFDRDKIDRSDIYTWDDMIDKFFEALPAERIAA